MVLGMKAGVSPGDFVWDGYPASSPKRQQSPIPFFSPFPLWSNGRMHQDTNVPFDMEVGLSPGDFVLDGDPASPQ